MHRHGLAFPQLSDDRGAVYAHFRISAQPALVLIDVEGEVTTMFGAADHDSLEAALENLTSP